MRVLDWCSIFSILPPGGMVLFYWNRLSMPGKVIGVLVLFTLLMEFLGTYMFLSGINNLILFNLFTWIEGLILITYYVTLSETRQYRMLFYIWGLAFILFSLFSAIYGQQIDHYNSLQRSIGSIWVAVLCMLFLFKIFQESTVINLFNYPPFLMTSAFLLYFAGTLFHNLFADYLMINKIKTFNSFDIHSVLNIFLNTIYTIVTWMDSRKTISRRS